MWPSALLAEPPHRPVPTLSLPWGAADQMQRNRPAKLLNNTVEFFFNDYGLTFITFLFTINLLSIKKVFNARM